MAPKAAQETAKKKAAKQKKILIVLALPMLGALVYAYMTMSSLGGKPEVSATPGRATTPASAIPTAGRRRARHARGRRGAGRRAALVHRARPEGSVPRQRPARHREASSSSEQEHARTQPNEKGKAAATAVRRRSRRRRPLTGAVISINGNKLALALGAKFGHAPGLSGVSLFRLVKRDPEDRSSSTSSARSSTSRSTSGSR